MAQDLEYHRFHQAVGTDTLGTRVVNALSREGIRSLAALSVLADAIGMAALRVRVATTPQLGAKSWDRVERALENYRTNGDVVPTHQDSVLEAQRDRMQRTARTLSSWDGRPPLLADDPDGMTVEDLRTVLRIIVGKVL